LSPCRFGSSGLGLGGRFAGGLLRLGLLQGGLCRETCPD